MRNESGVAGSRSVLRPGLQAALLGILAAGCASTPREHLYSLEGVAVAAASDQRIRPTVAVGPLSVPQAVDRPQLVLREGEYGILINEQQRWAAPLKESLPRVLAAELSRRVPERRFVALSAAAVNAPAGRLAIDFSRVDLSPGTGAWLNAHWVYRPRAAGGTPIEGDSAVHAGSTRAGYPGLVDALHTACAALADDLAAQLGGKLDDT